ncbi:MAG TPA: hypothetical protein VN493_13260 [Thermoanaerobaculia bacterium]|nr:hypothetical protein [Thermoanaerobaculia bacterium]
MKTAIPTLLLLGLCISRASGAAQIMTETAPLSVATPLIEVEARGIRTTDIDIPLCGNTCDDLDPHFISYRVAITTGGTVAGTLTEKKLEDESARAVTRIFSGTATSSSRWRLSLLFMPTPGSDSSRGAAPSVSPRRSPTSRTPHFTVTNSPIPPCGSGRAIASISSSCRWGPSRVRPPFATS